MIMFVKGMTELRGRLAILINFYSLSTDSLVLYLMENIFVNIRNIREK